MSYHLSRVNSVHTMIDCDYYLRRYEPDMSLLVSKEPTLCNGVFQLNFGGRVKVRRAVWLVA